MNNSEDIQKKELEENWTLVSQSKYQTLALVDHIIQRNPESVVLIPESMISEKAVDLLIKYDTSYVKYIPIQYQTEEFCLKLLKEYHDNTYPIFTKLKIQYPSTCKLFLSKFPASFREVKIVNGSTLEEILALLDEKEKMIKILSQ